MSINLIGVAINSAIGRSIQSNQLFKVISHKKINNLIISRGVSRSMNRSGSTKSSSQDDSKKDALGTGLATSLSEAAAAVATSTTNQKEALPQFQSSISITSMKSVRSNNLTMKVHPIRALQDNYMYLLVDETTRQAAAVDPVNASAIASAVSDHGVELKAILTTHHHHDHAHGNADLLSMFPDITVYGGDTRVQALTRAVSDREIIKLGGLTVQCLHTPCHTKGHICYYVTGQPSAAGFTETESGTNLDLERAVFTGDTLFIAGCGRFFEGSAEQMNRSLNKTLAKLPDDTRVYCGHEYTVSNLRFALSVEPQNSDIKLKLEWAQSKVAKREPTVPSTIGEEKRINPFMRLKKTEVKKYTGETDEIEVMAVLRQRKNDLSVVQ